MSRIYIVGGVSGPTPMDYTADDLWLQIITLTNSTGVFIVHPPQAEATNGVYDLFMTTNLTRDVPGLNLTNWMWLLRTDPGETNLLVPDLTADQAFFMLGRTNDSDGDLMSDAYEHLVTHTDPNHPDAPIILVQPFSQEVDQGDTVTFSVVAEGAQPLIYQWFVAGNPVTGETNSCLTIPSADPSQQGDYSVQVTSPVGLSVLSSNATLTVDSGYNWPLVTLTGQRYNYTFKNGVTYYVGSKVELYGVTTIEGGAIIKADWYSTDSTLAIMGTLVCKTDDAYFPAFFTSVDDDTLGDAFYWSSGYPAPANNGAPYLDLTSCQDSVRSLSNLRIRYADQGVALPAATRVDIWDCQFLQCNTAVVADQGSTAAFHNGLFASCGTVAFGLTNFAAITAEHITADVTNFWSAYNPGRIALTNSIIVGSIAAGPTLVTDHTAVNPASPFQAVGSANYYLASSSQYRHAGNAAVSPRLLSEFHQKTTQPPSVFPAFWQLNGEMVLGPQAERYTNGAPDYGFYYPALDYTVGWLTSWGTITVLPGTSIGFRKEYSTTQNHWTWWGFELREGSSFISQGTPTKPNTFTDVQFVQEQLTGPCDAGFVPNFWPNDAGLGAPQMTFQFSHFYANPGWNLFWSGYDANHDFLYSPDSLVNWSMQDCSLHGGSITLGEPDDGSTYGAPADWVYGYCSVSWKNNLFDNVSIDLDPTFYEYGADALGLNCDMGFQAYNNLFRGGLWLHLEPIPASAGNWVFKDNLFEKTDFIQDTNSPIDVSNNGYWPLTTSELAWLWNYYPWYSANTSQLLPGSTGGGGSEQVLASAPPYEAGPLGDYYLPITTPLYHNGSRTANDAGLFHYTTRVNQINEGEEFSGHMVNIGLHYVSVTNGVPRDSDGDGIPDYAENWHGDGAYSYHTDSETDWQTPYTVDGVYDPTNSVYDDRDLSGNGLIGRVKQSLNLGPFDTTNPLALLGLAPNAQVAGETTIPLALSGHTNALGSVLFFVDGQQSETGDIQQDTNANWSAVWDTTTLANSAHPVQVGYSYISAAGVQHTAFGPLAMPQVYNPIIFDPINDGFSDVLYIRGTLQVPVSSYSIDIYADDAQHTYLTNIAGTPSGNMIDESLDFAAAGITLDSGVECDITFPQTAQSTQRPGVRPMDASGMPPFVKHYSMERCFPGNSFTLGWGWDFGSSNDKARRGEYVRMGLVDMLGTDLNGEEFDLLPPGPGGNVPYTSSFQHDGSQSAHDRLLYSIADTDSQSFFFWGHGFANGFTWTRFDSYPPAALRADEIANITGNPGGTNTDHIYRHPYRFVFLDACGAYSRQVIQAFGIPYSKNGSTSTVADYLQWHREPRAFIGWDVTVVGSDITDDLADLYRVTAQQIVLGYWQAGYSLRDAMQGWDLYLPDKRYSRLGTTYQQIDPNADDPTNPGHKVGVYPPMKSWKISGCVDLNRYSPIP